MKTKEITRQEIQLIDLFQQLSIHLDRSILDIGHNIKKKLIDNNDSNLYRHLQQLKSSSDGNQHQETHIKTSLFHDEHMMDIQNPNIQNTRHRKHNKQAKLSRKQYQKNLIKIQEGNFQSLAEEAENNEKQYNLMSLLAQIPHLVYNPKLELKIQSTSLHQVGFKRKQQLFKRYKTKQNCRLKELKKKYIEKYPQFSNDSDLETSGKIVLEGNDSQEHILMFNHADFDKLSDETDLNDAIINNYLQILQVQILPKQISSKVHIFSSFFMTKLLGQILINEEIAVDQYQKNMILLKNEEVDKKIGRKQLTYVTKDKINKKIKENFVNIKRWTKKFDLFSKEYLVFPINAYKHWNCVIVRIQNITEQSSRVNNTQTINIKLFLLDSMFEMKFLFPEAIKTYLEFMSCDRQSGSCQININKISSQQKIVPRQTNTHDCGLYTIRYIESFLQQPKFFQKNTDCLSIFPRSVIYCIRKLLRTLFYDLIETQNAQDPKKQTQFVIQQYVNTIKQIISESAKQDYDEIDRWQLNKCYKLLKNYLKQIRKMEDQIAKNQEIRNNLIDKKSSSSQINILNLLDEGYLAAEEQKDNNKIQKNIEQQARRTNQDEDESSIGDEELKDLSISFQKENDQSIIQQQQQQQQKIESKPLKQAPAKQRRLVKKTILGTDIWVVQFCPVGNSNPEMANEQQVKKQQQNKTNKTKTKNKKLKQKQRLQLQIYNKCKLKFYLDPAINQYDKDTFF